MQLLYFLHGDAGVAHSPHGYSECCLREQHGSRAHCYVVGAGDSFGRMFVVFLADFLLRPNLGRSAAAV